MKFYFYVINFIIFFNYCLTEWYDAPFIRLTEVGPNNLTNYDTKRFVYSSELNERLEVLDENLIYFYRGATRYSYNSSVALNYNSLHFSVHPEAYRYTYMLANNVSDDSFSYFMLISNLKIYRFPSIVCKGHVSWYSSGVVCPTSGSTFAFRSLLNISYIDFEWTIPNGWYIEPQINGFPSFGDDLFLIAKNNAIIELWMVKVRSDIKDVDIIQKLKLSDSPTDSIVVQLSSNPGNMTFSTIGILNVDKKTFLSFKRNYNYNSVELSLIDTVPTATLNLSPYASRINKRILMANSTSYAFIFGEECKLGKQNSNGEMITNTAANLCVIELWRDDTSKEWYIAEPILGNNDIVWRKGFPNFNDAQLFSGFFTPTTFGIDRFFFINLISQKPPVVRLWKYLDNKSYVVSFNFNVTNYLLPYTVSAQYQKENGEWKNVQIISNSITLNCTEPKTTYNFRILSTNMVYQNINNSLVFFHKTNEIKDDPVVSARLTHCIQQEACSNKCSSTLTCFPNQTFTVLTTDSSSCSVEFDSNKRKAVCCEKKCAYYGEKSLYDQYYFGYWASSSYPIVTQTWVKWYSLNDINWDYTEEVHKRCRIENPNGNSGYQFKIKPLLLIFLSIILVLFLL